MIWTPKNSSAVFSACRHYRYELWRKLQPTSGLGVAFLGLNPSTATEHEDDPTIRRCWRFAERWGYAEFVMLNAFAFRATDPRDMLEQVDPVGPKNDASIVRVCELSDLIVAAWGVHGAHLGCGDQVLELLEPFASKMRCLGRTKDGHPRHPLYLRNDAELEKFP